MIKATVNTTGINRVSIKSRQSNIVKTITINPDVATGLRELRDVNATSLNNNDTVVYDAASDKFIVKELPVLNGGTF